MPCHISIPVADSSAIGEARRAIVSLAQTAKLGEADAGRASIVATELATNLVRHAKPESATILAASTGPSAIEILSIDSGPGMADVARCFVDGYSTAGTPGNGLGAIRRLSDELDIYSADSGTVVWCRIQAKDRPATMLPSLRTGGLSIPAPGEFVCGDSWRIVRSDDSRISLMIADGLGHGPFAADASDAACVYFDAQPFTNPSTLVEGMHGAISGTRGAAIAVAQIEPTAGKLSYCGVGNIAGTLISEDGSTRGLFSHNGTVGHTLRKAQLFDYPWTPGSFLVLHSDGLQTRWSLAKYAGLSRRHPAVIAGVLLRDFRRGRDDASVLVISSPTPRN